MTPARRPAAVLAGAVLAALAAGGCTRPPAAAPAAPAAPALPAAAAPTPPPATRITRVVLGNALGSDHHVLLPRIVFAPGDPLYLTVELHGAAPATPHRLGVKWTHESSRQRVLEEAKLLQFAGPAYSSFQLSNAHPWPAGLYKVEVMLDGHLAQSRLFEVH